MSLTILSAGARTPIGRLGGALASLSAVDLGAAAVTAALQRAGITGAAVDAVIMGNVVQAGVGPNPARQIAVNAGIPLTTPALTLNNLCLSGLQSIIEADRLIRCGEADIVVAGGAESMTNAPHLAARLRAGVRYGSARLDDALDRDALVCAFDRMSMGAATEKYLAGTGIDRLVQDEFAARSHARAADATDNGFLADEIVPVQASDRRQQTVTADEGVRRATTAAALGELKPAFDPHGTITAGSSSQLSDGAAAVVLMSADRARTEGAPVLATLGASAFVAGPDTSLLHQPAEAIRRALARSDLKTPADLDLLEINEAFAGVAIASINELEVDPDRVNIHGGAIALGHPVGMSGARLALTLALSLKERGGGVGAAALCGGGGQGNALLLHTR